jgi:hypothetical protein
MGALFIVLSPILLDDHLGFSPAEKPFHMQTFIAKFPNKALHGPVLPGLAWLDVRWAHATGGSPTLDRMGHTFGAVITPDVPRHLMSGDEALEHFDDPAGMDATADLNRSTHRRVLIYHHKAFQGFPSRTAIVHEIVGPNVVRPRGLWRTSHWRVPSPAAVPDVQVEAMRPPQPMDALMIHPYPLSPQQRPHPTISVTRMLLGDAP